MGYDARAWALLVLVTLTAQLLGHSVFNYLLDRIRPVVVSLALLLEIPGAALIAAVLLGQVPPAGVFVGLVLILAGMALVVLAAAPARRQRSPRSPTPVGSRALSTRSLHHQEQSVQTQVVILAAGLGTRLGRPHPKPLTPLSTGETIMRRAVDLLREAWPDVRVTAVVGFKLDLVIEAMPDISFVYNEVYDSTNTNKSLLKALQLSHDGGVLWMNGDVVFDPRVLGIVEERIAAGQSFVCVDHASVAEEEVKYTLGDDGMINELSKTVVGRRSARRSASTTSPPADKAALIARLDECDDQDYFERGIELAIERDGLRVEPVDISEYPVVEVDFDDDLTRPTRSSETESELTAASVPGPTSGRVDDAGIALGDADEVILDVSFDGRRIWSFWLLRDSEARSGGRRVGAGPSRCCVPRRRAPGSASPSTSPAGCCYDEEVGSAAATARIAVVNDEGKPLGIDKSGRMAQTFDTRSAEQVAPLLDAIEEVLAALREAGIEAFPAYGTLLGAVREGRADRPRLRRRPRLRQPARGTRSTWSASRSGSSAGWPSAATRSPATAGCAFKVDVVEGDGSVRGLDVFGGFLSRRHAST